MPFLDVDTVFTKEIAEGVRMQVAWVDKIMLSLCIMEHGSKVDMHIIPGGVPHMAQRSRVPPLYSTYSIRFNIRGSEDMLSRG